MPDAPSLGAQRLLLWWEHPSEFVRDVFKIEPDPWQIEVLEAFPHNPRMALKASKGPGKTCLLAWLAWNFLVTRPHPKIAATSISADNLSDNLWTEMAKWMHQSPMLQNFFTWTKTRIFSKQYPETWWMSARTWPKTGSAEDQANTLAGLHADYILFLIDESGGIPSAVMATAEAALASGIEGHIVQAGNPTHLEGPLYDACTTQAALWWKKEISGDPDDPNRAPRVSIEWARQQIEMYGRENPWVLVNVFGRFPPASINALIGPDEMTAAMNRWYREHEYRGAPKIMAVDVARFGDDASVKCKRQGLQVFPFEVKRNIDSVQGAGWLARDWTDWKADACFIDDTGGFGAGWIDQLVQMRYKPIGVNYSSQAFDATRYFNKRAEMYFEAVEWIKRGGALPPCPELTAALTRTTYTFRGDRLILEPKESVKEKIGYSPDHADAFITTFAFPVQPKPDPLAQHRGQRRQKNYNPLAEIEAEVEREYGRTMRDD